jgi:DNA-binding IclR family transcriptional regulator
MMPAVKPEPVRPIRSLLRGLEVLSALGGGEGRTVTETAKRARLPRTTAYRVLETLRLSGYVARDENDRYRPTDKARIMTADERAYANGHAANGASAQDAA